MNGLAEDSLENSFANPITLPSAQVDDEHHEPAQSSIWDPFHEEGGIALVEVESELAEWSGRPIRHSEFFTEGSAQDASTLEHPTADQRGRVESLLELEPGWDGYGAPPPSRAAVNATLHAMAVVDLLRAGWDFGASVEGGVAFSRSQDNRLAVLEFDNDGDILAVSSSSDGYVRVWELAGDAASLRQALRELNEFLQGRA